MQKIKNEKGITLVALILTIIITIMIAGITINLGMDSINSTRDRKLQAELEMVGQATITEYSKAMELGYIKEGSTQIPQNFIGTPTSNPEALPTGTWALSDSEAVGYKSYFVLNPQALEKLEILNSNHTYIINYYTGEVFNQTKQKSSQGQTLYIKMNTGKVTEKTEDTTSFVE
ncbi:MAG: hypothetical protein OSJ66_00320 [Clostridia bacterium]|nr:hypothetical protein [Clostridia bacterium]